MTGLQPRKFRSSSIMDFIKGAGTDTIYNNEVIITNGDRTYVCNGR